MRKHAAVARSPLDRRIGVHDRHQFELKLEYLPPEGARHAHYIVETFVCVPSNLNVSPETVPLEDLSADVHNYVRLKTPELGWSELVALPDAPLARVATELGAVAAGADPTRFAYECKMFACVFRAALREAAEHAVEILGDEPDPEDAAHLRQVAEEIETALAGRAAAAAAFRALRERVQALPIERARVAYQLADEYASLSTEQVLRRVIVAASRLQPTIPEADALEQRILEVILLEENYRRERGYPTIIDPRSDNEPYIYRSGLLKKYCSSALFLPIHREGARRRWQELLFAIAAGIAMAFATVVAFWAQARYSGLGLRLFVILVVAYMLKDRLKEATRGLFARLLERTLYDRKIVIDDPAGGILGVCREKIEFLKEWELPPEAREVRRQGMDAAARVAEEELTENIIHYKKELMLHPRHLVNWLGGGLTDILRFHVARLLRDMDEPDLEIEYLDQATHLVEPVRAVKTYHVDVVFQFTSRMDQAPQTTLMRLVLDRNGIKRVERHEVGGEPVT